MPSGVYRRGKFTLEEFFEQRVNKGDACWEWTGAMYPNGYGECRGEYAHRVSYELNTGELASGLQVLHTCDNRRCVRPNHLYAGTDADNRRDARDRNRYPGNAKSSRAKLTSEQVMQIKKRSIDLLTSLSQEKVSALLADDYGVTRFAVRDVLCGRTWNHIQPK